MYQLALQIDGFVNNGRMILKLMVGKLHGVFREIYLKEKKLVLHHLLHGEKLVNI